MSGPPIAIAIDGRSGSGKSTLAKELAARLDATLVKGDDFYAGGIELRRDSRQSRVEACIDWRRQFDVLQQLRKGHVASWHAFDWEAFDGSLEASLTSASGPLIVCEGVYSARPELASLFDLRILLTVPDEVRLERLFAREGGISPWERQWHEAEEWYFARIMPPARFDLVVADEPAGGSAKRPGRQRESSAGGCTDAQGDARYAAGRITPIG